MRASEDSQRCRERKNIYQCNLRSGHADGHDFTSIRKPFNDKAGYIVSLRSGKDRGWVVIYEAALQGIDVGGTRHATVCESHATIDRATSLPQARSSMKSPASFCEDCR